MADLIPWEAIEPGMTVWEECSWGGGPIRMEIIRRDEGGNLYFHCTLANGATCDGVAYADKAFAQAMIKSPEFRYWNAEPTPNEMEGAPWE